MNLASISAVCFAGLLLLGGCDANHQGADSATANIDQELARLNAENKTLRAAATKRDPEGIASCSSKAESVYRQLGFSEASPAHGGTISSFQNHFSGKYGRCLMLLQTTNYGDGSVLNSEQLYDPFERRDFGTMDLFSQPPGAPGMLATCTLQLPGEAKQTCRSKDEFEAKARAAMDS